MFKCIDLNNLRRKSIKWLLISSLIPLSECPFTLEKLNITDEDQFTELKNDEV